ncbi:hypothetical protein MOMA_00635 [Moraxella macacae 0408225]|uniref:Uncharacterized protein n=1 Tax=Moraxella macacae 0408225 TaxID=1230338 RepID=L2F8S4_9GAMM|nr:hypothetical protein [Moraxella macacae]ELA08873.1 hypothetical protein MOMA_00635 [Moraxella macacae 0408225]
MKALRKLATVAVLSVACVNPSFASIEIDESNFGPTYGSMIADTVAGKPLQLATVAGGVVTFVASLPFTFFTGDVAASKRVLIDEPFQALDRCLGCTPAQDAYYKSKKAHNSNEVRLVVDGPSEIYINTDQNVVVTQP